ncbi:uncharacterized protein LOC111713001 isoform X1 [Eurytemora carolleeae]|uniref:uncharacterized protein LOC111713001 isoform X1 n=1 Tax=Eurytemora carolleeae TaxID=1294199 RepID=UPI000C77F221|nr:uncharacterized protein LOC111713001 isoform X1 [Eurytemora carolleeae]|eukprot:XP_023343542.1 uncharacterized protein LOC111713001 isoform X1 [Eurytemora affinis]
MGGLINEAQDSSIQLQCLPLYSIIKSLGNPVINLLILDFEGAEQLILETLPWEKASIRVLIESKGYKRFPHRGARNPLTGREQNDLFIREDIVQKYNVIGYSSKL